MNIFQRRKLTFLIIIFIFIFLLLITFGRFQQTNLGQSIPITPISLIIPFIISSVIAIILNVSVSWEILLSKNQKRIYQAMKEHDKPVKTKYEIFKLAKGMSKGTVYNNLKKLIEAKVIIEEDGHLKLNK